MTRISTAAFCLTALLLSAFAAAPARADGPAGLWLTEKKGVVVDVYACAEALCARTVWMKRMTHKDGTPRLDSENPDPGLRHRHWCGIEVIKNVKPVGPGTWEGGTVYDPKTGKTFDFDIKEKGKQLKVRGYLGVPLLGKTETWTRTDGAGLTFCPSS